jgi:hypothetical protein
MQMLCNNHISGHGAMPMVSVLASSVVDCGFGSDERLVDCGFGSDERLGICCFSTMHTELRSKMLSNDNLAGNQGNVSEWSHMSTHSLLL